jgi:AbrB family looped-hinge helix DNA binding protein
MPRPSTSIDAFGRVVIPKRARDRYGLAPGTTIEVEESPAGIVLRAASLEPVARRKDGVLVLTARADVNLEDRIEGDRAARLRHLRGRGGR